MVTIFLFTKKFDVVPLQASSGQVLIDDLYMEIKA